MKSFISYEPFDFVSVDPVSLLNSIFSDTSELKTGARIPAIDVVTTDNTYVIDAELPGLTENDVSLTVERGHLVLSANIAKTEEKSEKRYLLKERSAIAFKRSFKLPDDANAEAISATFKNGILTITIAKKPESSPKLIPVNAA